MALHTYDLAHPRSMHREEECKRTAVVIQRTSLLRVCRTHIRKSCFIHYFSHHCDKMSLLPEATCGRWGSLGLLILSHSIMMEGMLAEASIHSRRNMRC